MTWRTAPPHSPTAKHAGLVPREPPCGGSLLFWLPAAGGLPLGSSLVDPPAAAGYTLFQNFPKRPPPGHGPAFHAPAECWEELLTPSELARKTVDLASEKQASDILLLDLRSLQVFTDYFIILTAESRRQIDALKEDLAQALKEMGVTNLRQEGTSESGWVLLDIGDVVVHIFAPEERAFYQLEQLWSNARQVVRIQ